MEVKQRCEFVKHLNLLSMILELNIVYWVGFDSEGKSGIPNASYDSDHEAMIFAWLPDFNMYSEDALKEYIEMADREFEDNRDDNVNEAIEEARTFYNSL